MSSRSAFSAFLCGVAAIAVMLTVLALEGCRPPAMPDERAVARGAVLATAAAVKAADEACAQFGAATRDVPLLERCADHYDAARIALISTATAIDLWERVETRGSVACALGRALTELEQLGQDLAAHGRPPPPIIADARALAAALPRCADGS